MTKIEYTGKRDLFFSNWCRENLPDSKTGFLVSDIDFILYDYRLKKIMLLEIKNKMTDLEYWQAQMFNNIHTWIKAGISTDWQYLGFHKIQFENTNFENGKCYFNGTEIQEESLIEKLSFGKISKITMISDAVEQIEFKDS